METNYILMRKNTPLMLVVLDDDGQIVYASKEARNADQLPLQYRYQQGSIRIWWAERSIPIEQGKIRDFLEKNGFSMPEQYLKKNLGLSLTDYYWIKPVDSDLAWEDVNLFDNDFRENILFAPGAEDEDELPHYSPNSSLQGQIEKTWAIFDGKRYMVKGNRTNLSSESINEVIASEIHRRQGYDNYTDYELLKIFGSDYDYGCRSKLFTSQEKEFVSAYAVCTMQKKPGDVSLYEHFINMCGSLGMDTEALRADLEYQIMTDLLISNYDRHLNNLGILRDAQTLRPIRMAPIYDSGGSLYVNRQKPKAVKELLSLKTGGFSVRESSLIKLVRNPGIVDLTKLPPVEFVREAYGMDTQIADAQIDRICWIYEQKIDICRQIQLGRDPFRQVYAGVSRED